MGNLLFLLINLSKNFKYSTSKQIKVPCISPRGNEATPCLTARDQGNELDDSSPRAGTRRHLIFQREDEALFSHPSQPTSPRQPRATFLPAQGDGTSLARGERSRRDVTPFI
ncbi:hypothetical protein B296_00046929 [Ensete ventricosum]|uniref:Uncharacterized protein n=1 Tax=Ensete ventricosum TaxID=4639 RepID=A0A426Z1V7_ENSVE|nr:hypothetical protein B296_00046929 [Ensete ventricosum]